MANEDEARMHFPSLSTATLCFDSVDRLFASVGCVEKDKQTDGEEGHMMLMDNMIILLSIVILTNLKRFSINIPRNVYRHPNKTRDISNLKIVSQI